MPIDTEDTTNKIRYRKWILFYHLTICSKIPGVVINILYWYVPSSTHCFLKMTTVILQDGFGQECETQRIGAPGGDRIFHIGHAILREWEGPIENLASEFSQGFHQSRQQHHFGCCLFRILAAC